MDITPIQTFIEQILVFIPKLFLAVVIFLVSIFLANLVAKVVKRALKMRDTDPEVTLLLARIARWTTIILGTIFGLQQVDFNVSAFVAGLGVVGFTVGFALKDIAENFVAGILLLLQQPFDIGDAIEVSGYGGTVTNIEIRSTELRTWDGKLVMIPNAEVYTNTITNFTRSPVRRSQLEVGVAYNSNLDEVTKIVKAALQDIDGVDYDEKPPTISFDTFADSSINLSVLYWVDTTQSSMLEAKDRAIKNVKKALEQAEVEIPFPVRMVVMGKQVSR